MQFLRTRLSIGLAMLIVAMGLAIVFALNRPADAFQGETPTPTLTPFTQALPTRVPGIPSPPAPAISATVTVRAVPIGVKATGNIASVNQATLAFQIGGRVKEIKAKEGDRVKAGTLIATLDTGGLDAQVASAQSALDKVKAGPSTDDVVIAKAALDRAKAALDQAQAAYDKIGGSSNPGIAASSQALTLQQATSNFQEALARFNQAVNHPTPQELTAAQAALETAKQSAAGARLIAPFDGTVLWIGVRVGESTSVGTAAAAIADLSHMQAQVNVDEISAAFIQVGQRAIISVDALPGKDLRGHVSRIALLGTATGNLVTVPVTVDIDTPDATIYPGLSATVEIQGGNP